jgi:hypothetical protein
MSHNTFCNCQLLGGWYLWRFPLRFACHIPTACRQDRRDPGFYPTLPERDLGIHPVGGLTQNLDCYNTWGWVVSVTPLPCITPGERTLGTHCTRGWVGPRAGLDTEARGKTLSPLPGIEPQSPGHPVRSQTLYCPSYPSFSWDSMVAGKG